MSATTAQSQDLGKEIGRYPASFSHTYGAVAFTGVCFLLAPVAFFGLTILWSGLGAGMDEVMKETPFLQYLPLILAGVAVLVGLISLYNAWRDWPLSVALYDRGIEYADRRGTRRLGWGDLTNIAHYITRHTLYGIIPVGTTHVFVLTDASGAAINLDGRFARYGDLTDKLSGILKPAQK